MTIQRHGPEAGTAAGTLDKKRQQLRRPPHNGTFNSGGSIYGARWGFQAVRINDLEMWT